MKPAALAICAALISAPALAQPQAVASEPMAADPIQKPCPAGGYAPPAYGAFGDNDGLIRAYEIASPCVGPEVRAIASAIGMGRYRPLGVKNISTARFTATGRIADSKGRLVDAKVVDVGVNFGFPALRLGIEGQAGGKPVKEIRVFNDTLAWDETEPGVGGREVKAAELRGRAPLVKLNPFGAVWSLVEAEGHAVISKAGGQTVITGTSPYDGYKVTVTIDEKNRPVRVQVLAEGATWGATFDGYSDKWESPYLFIFPERIAWTRNGKPLADLKVTGFHSNPYVVFPTPAEMKAAALAAGKAE